MEWNGGMEQWNGMELFSKTLLDIKLFRHLYYSVKYIVYNMHLNMYYYYLSDDFCYILINSNHCDMCTNVRMALGSNEMPTDFIQANAALAKINIY